jgi:hypothetical protein
MTAVDYDIDLDELLEEVFGPADLTPEEAALVAAQEREEIEREFQERRRVEEQQRIAALEAKLHEAEEKHAEDLRQWWLDRYTMEEVCALAAGLEQWL